MPKFYTMDGFERTYGPRIFLERSLFDQFPTLQATLKQLCCWGGYDKEWFAHDGSSDALLGWEFPSDKIRLQQAREFLLSLGLEDGGKTIPQRFF